MEVAGNGCMTRDRHNTGGSCAFEPLQVTSFGMSEKIGPLSFSRPEDSNTLYKPYSEKTAQMIDDEADRIVSAAYKRSVELLTNQKESLHRLAQRLLEKEVCASPAERTPERYLVPSTAAPIPAQSLSYFLIVAACSHPGAWL